MKKNILVLAILLFSSLTVLGQQNKKFSKKNKVVNKGKFFVYWGWNWSSYTDSDIRFKGKDYDFTLTDVKAQDRPTKFSVNNYFNPGNITIPQNNYRIGYFFKENYTISIGVDHMKYVVNNDQNVTINGNINIGNAKYDGTYNNQNIQLTEDFLRFEHTDGLNYVNVEVKRFDNIDHWFGLDLKNLQINLTEGIGVGGLYPRTDTSLLGKERHDNFHLSGWGVSVGAGLNITFLKHFYIQSDYKIGYINMPDIKTSLSSADSASQSFYFFENNILIGGRFRIF
ncbi:hypothetical protein [Polaribacter sp. KT 15]|uniref:hypothetical protein n=1 Tax=Polaribacter sp. KT 15 TaxID=1896175 RepID=UPI00090BCE90|nr:hypothetical protein [Polaribacter sp. KT 15]SHM74405.1 hypothetical protein SAMN05720268_0303 [Polaribacter sp. KT 15]